MAKRDEKVRANEDPKIMRRLRNQAARQVQDLIRESWVLFQKLDTNPEDKGAMKKFAVLMGIGQRLHHLHDVLGVRPSSEQLWFDEKFRGFDDKFEQIKQRFKVEGTPGQPV